MCHKGCAPPCFILTLLLTNFVQHTHWDYLPICVEEEFAEVGRLRRVGAVMVAWSTPPNHRYHRHQLSQKPNPWWFLRALPYASARRCGNPTHIEEVTNEGHRNVGI